MMEGCFQYWRGALESLKSIEFMLSDYYGPLAGDSDLLLLNSVESHVFLLSF